MEKSLSGSGVEPQRHRAEGEEDTTAEGAKHEASGLCRKVMSALVREVVNVGAQLRPSAAPSRWDCPGISGPPMDAELTQLPSSSTLHPMPDPAPEHKRKCEASGRTWGRCPFDAEPGEKLCIFHLPLEKKKPEDFRQHLASYLEALYENAGTEKTDAFWRGGGQNYRLFDDAVPGRADDYKLYVQKGKPWVFRGFVFPDMSVEYEFNNLVFPAVDFRDAKFRGIAYFLDAEFSGKASFWGAEFHDVAWFQRAEFGQEASFRLAKFKAGAYFPSAEFHGVADFEHARLDDIADFMDGGFAQDASFWRAKFGGEAHFSGAKFCGALLFDRACFSGKRTAFQRVRFLGRVSFAQATLDTLLTLGYANIYNQVLFDGTESSDRAMVLLWGLNFVHGQKELELEEDRRKGTVIEPAGQVVFRDIREGMSRVSFLHTDILTDRLHVRFSNVKWEKDPKKFLFDARFVFEKDPTNWAEKTGLPQVTIDLLPELFFSDLPVPEREKEEQRLARKERDFKRVKELVQSDVERIAREIRVSHEKYGNYPDAGDYYVAEMSFRRKRLPRRAWLKRPALWLYWLVSRYGESPTRAGCWLVGWIAISAVAFMLRSLGWRIGPFRWSVPNCLQLFGPAWRDFVLSVIRTTPELIPFWSRPSSTKFSDSWTFATAVSQLVFYVLLALFLLAVRRRFRR